MKLLGIFSTTVWVMLSSSAQASECPGGSSMDAAWSGDGPYQGYWMASVTGGGSQIIASCDMGGANGSSLKICLNGETPTDPDLNITVDNEEPYDISLNHYYQGGFNLKRDLTLASKQAFDKLVDDMRRGEQISIVTKDGDSATFTLRGAANALYDCAND